MRRSKRTTESVHQLDVRELRRVGVFQETGLMARIVWRRAGTFVGAVFLRNETDHITLLYRHREWGEHRGYIRLDQTPCHYGGVRIWFTCPDCGSRVALLYGLGGRFLCRHCCGLCYKSQNETDRDRAIRRVRKVRQQLGASPNLFEAVKARPRGMHRSTFSQLLLAEQQHWAAVSEIAARKWDY